MRIMPEKVSTGVALGTSATSSAYWFTQFLDKYTPNQWAAIGVIGSLAFGFLTLLVSIYFQWRADQRKASRGK